MRVQTTGRRRVVAIILAMLIACAHVALGQAGTPDKLIIGQPSTIQFVDPQRTYLSTEAAVWHSLYDALVFRTADTSLVPGLAKSWTQTGDTEWTLELQEGVAFHNGEPFNAEVVLWNINRATAPGFQDWAFLSPIAGAEVVDEFTIKITTKNPYPIFPSLLAMFMMLPPNYMDEVGIEGFNRAPIGTGPYKFARWEDGALFEVEANPNYWNETKRPTFDSVVWRIIPEDGTRLAALMAGEVDVIAKLPPDDFEMVDSRPNLRAEWVRSTRTPLFRFFPDSPQGEGEPFNDIRVRRAFNHGIDVDGMLQALFGGRGFRTATLMTPEFAGYDPTVLPYEYDPELARELLSQAGYPNGLTVKFEVSGETVPKTMEIAQIAASQLAEIGVTANIIPLDDATGFIHQNERTISAFNMWSWGGSQLECRDKFWGIFHPESSANFLSDDGVTALVNELEVTMDSDARNELCVELQHKVRDLALIVPLFAQADLYGYSADLRWEPRSDELIFPWEIERAQ